MERYGIELILDLSGCDTSKFNRTDIRSYFTQLCDLIDMEASDFHFWDDLDTPDGEKQTNPKTVGTSAIQFILTSNITIHTLNLLGAIFINIFSCKEFDTELARLFTIEFFRAEKHKGIEVERRIL